MRECAPCANHSHRPARPRRSYEVHDDGSAITVQPGLIGAEVNRILAAHKAKHKLPVQVRGAPSWDHSTCGAAKQAARNGCAAP